MIVRHDDMLLRMLFQGTNGTISTSQDGAFLRALFIRHSRDSVSITLASVHQRYFVIHRIFYHTLGHNFTQLKFCSFLIASTIATKPALFENYIYISKTEFKTNNVKGAFF